MFNLEGQLVVTNKQGQNQREKQAEWKNQKQKHRYKQSVNNEKAIRKATKSKRTRRKKPEDQEVKTLVTHRDQ